jgi:hypothetical protein
MTTDEWQTCTDPRAMLQAISWDERRTPPCLVSPRKLHLFAVACCRACWPLLTDQRSRHAVEVAEQHADDKTVLLAVETAMAAEAWQEAARGSIKEEDLAAAALNCVDGGCLSAHPRLILDGILPYTTQASILRDIVGYPWNPVTAQDYWLTPQVLSLAAAAYEERPGKKCEGCREIITMKGRDPGWIYESAGPDSRWVKHTHCHGTGHLDDGTLDPDRLAVLSDALEEVGADERVIQHLRQQPCPYCKDADFSTGDLGTKMMGGQEPYASRAKTYFASKCQCNGTRLLHEPHYRGMWSLDLTLGRQ